MKIVVTLNETEIIAAVQAHLMDKGFDEGITVISMKALDNRMLTPNNYEFEVSDAPDARA